MIRASWCAPSTRRHFLLTESDNEFIPWDDEEREVPWLPLGSVTNAEIGARKTLPAHRQSDD